MAVAGAAMTMQLKIDGGSADAGGGDGAAREAAVVMAMAVLEMEGVGRATGRRGMLRRRRER